MENHQPNSHKYKEELKEQFNEKKVKRVVKGKVKTKKKNEMTKFKDVFISEDASNVKSYIFMDVLVPAVKKAISDIVRDGIDMILYGESGKREKGKSSSYVSYRDYNKRDERRDNRSARPRFDYDDLIFENRGEAEAVLEQMCDMIDRYGLVTVADMYDMADLTQPFTSNRYGWTRLGTAEVVRAGRDGYIIKLPRAVPID